jgi:hypothetical protein
MPPASPLTPGSGMPSSRSIGLLRIRDREQLEEPAAERHDPVVRPEALVPAAADDLEAELRSDPRSGGVQVRRRVDDVVDPHGVRR